MAASALVKLVLENAVPKPIIEDEPYVPGGCYFPEFLRAVPRVFLRTGSPVHMSLGAI